MATDMLTGGGGGKNDVGRGKSFENGEGPSSESPGSEYRGEDGDGRESGSSRVPRGHSFSPARGSELLPSGGGSATSSSHFGSSILRPHFLHDVAPSQLDRPEATQSPWHAADNINRSVMKRDSGDTCASQP